VSARGAVRVEAAGATRVAALSALHGACFMPGWSSESVARLLATPGARAWLAWTPPEAPEPCGFALARAGGGECELVSIGVLATRRRKGVGLALVGAWLGWAKAEGVGRCFLEVAEDNSAALALYAGLGFIEVGRRPGYYARGQGAASALVLSLDLTK
jgi:ribosomal-protein-alanine N-acetyltransferase